MFDSSWMAKGMLSTIRAASRKLSAISSEMLPDWTDRPSAPDRPERMRETSSSDVISAEKAITGFPERATFAAMPMASADLPTEGRAASVTICPGAKPPVRSSSDGKPLRMRFGAASPAQ
ncbi:hypothetical protein D3C86_773720 [compost metagenome]